MIGKRTKKIISIALSLSFVFSVAPNTIIKNNIDASAAVITYNKVDYSKYTQSQMTTNEISQMHEDNWLNQYVSDITGVPLNKLTISDFLNITEITYSNENIKEIPNSIKFLSNLEYLDLSANNIAKVPMDIANLKSLKYLDLSVNDLTTATEYLKFLSELKELNLSGNKITSYGSALSLLEKLEYLNLSGNRLTNFYTKYNSVKEVDLSDNFLTKDCSNYFPNAKTINLAYNFITTVDIEKHNQYQLSFKDQASINTEVNEKIDFSKILNTENLTSYQVVADDPSIVNSSGVVLKEGTTNIRVKISGNPDNNTNGITQEKIKLVATKSIFTVNKQSPQEIGTSITLSVPKKTNETYKFIIKDENNNWSLLQDFSTNNSCVWIPKTSGKKTLYVDIKDANGNVVRKSMPYEIKVNENVNKPIVESINFDKASPQSMGDNINISVKASGGTGTLNYQYRVSINGKTSTIKSYSTSNKCVWTPTEVGTATIYVDVKDANGQITTKTVGYTVINKAPAITSFSLDKQSPIWVGDNLTMTAKATGVGILRYQFEVTDITTEQTYILKSYSTSNTFSWSPKTQGLKRLTVKVKTEDGAISEKSIEITTKYKEVPLVISNFNVPSKGVVKNNVSLTTNATGTGILNYKYTVIKPKETNETVIKDYNTSNQCSFTPSQVGEYTVIVYVRDSLGVVSKVSKKFQSYSLLTMNEVNIDKVSPQKKGSTLTIKPIVSGGYGDLKYKYYIKDVTTNTIVYLKDGYTSSDNYTTSNSYKWYASSIGDKILYVDVKDSTGRVVTGSVPFSIINDAYIKSFTTDKVTPQKKGTQIKLTAVAESNSNDTLQYKFSVTDSSGDTYVIQDYSTKNTCVWNANTVGAKVLTVEVKEKSGYVIKSSMDYYISNPIEIKSFNSSTNTVNYGNNVRFTVNATGEEDSDNRLKYKFYYYKNGIQKVVKDYSESNICDWKAEDIAGNVVMYVSVKDKLGNTKTSSKTVNVTSTKPIINSFSVSAITDTRFSFKTSAIGGTGSLQYKYSYILNGEEKIISNWVSNTTTTFTPPVSGAYKFKVEVKDSNENIATKTLPEQQYTIPSDFKVDKKSPQLINTELNLTANVVSIKEVQYQFAFEKDGKTTIIQDYSSNRTCNYIPNIGGDITLKVNIKESNGNVITKTIPYKIVEKPTITSFTSDKTSPQAINTNINFTVNASSKYSSKLQYKFEIKDLSSGYSVLLQDFSTKNTLTRAFTSRGNKRIIVTVKDEFGFTNQKTMDYTLYSVPKINSFSANLSSPQMINTKVTLSANATSDEGSLLYRFRIAAANNPKIEYTLMDYSSVNSMVWTTKNIGDKILYVDVKDKFGNVITKSLKYKVVDTKPTITSFTGDKASPQKRGTIIKLTANANENGTSTGLLYQFYITDSNGNYGHAIQDYSTSNVCYWNADYTGNKKLIVNVKDKNGMVTSKTIDYKIIEKLEVGDFVTDTPSNIGTIGKPTTLTVENPKADPSTKYRFVVTDVATNKSYELKNSTSNICTWTPSKVGDKKLTVYITDNYGQSITKSITYKVNKASMTYAAHVQSYGWIENESEGIMVGTTGESKRLEALKIIKTSGCDGNIEYRTYANETGWSAWTKDGNISGTTGESRPLYKLEIKLTGDMAKYYNIEYQVHYAYQGWTKWYKNGETATPTNNTYYIQAIKIRLVQK